MDYIQNAVTESKIHWMVEKYSVGYGRTACGLVIVNGRTGATGYRELIDCKRCQSSLTKEN